MISKTKQKHKTHRYREQIGGCWGGDVVKKDEGGQKIQSSSYKNN